MTSKDKAIEVLKRYCVSEQWFKDNASDEDSNGCDEAHEYNDAVEYFEKVPSLDDAIAVVHGLIDKHDKLCWSDYVRGSEYKRTLFVVLDELTALRGLKEGK